MSLVDNVLFPYQVLAAKRIAESRRILLADQPGLGKTLEVLGALELDGFFDPANVRNVLVLTPIINAQTTWVDSVERFVHKLYPHVRVVDVSRGTAAKKDKLLADVGGVTTIVVANHNAAEWVNKKPRLPNLFNIVFDAVIVDESHLVLPIVSNSVTNFWRGLVNVKKSDECVRVAVSGTPDRGKLENRYGTWWFLYPELIPFNRFKWLEENFWMVDQKVSRTRTVRVPMGLRDEQHWLRVANAWMIRRTKKEVLPQLPDKQYVFVELELSDKQRGSYFGAQLDFEASLRAKDEFDPPAADALVFALRCRQLSSCQWQVDDKGELHPVVGGESVKLDWLLEWLDDRVDGKIVICSQFSKVLRWLQKELSSRGLVCAVLDGSTSDSDRVSIQRKFQDGGDPLRIVLLSGSMGVGINLDAADDLVMWDSPYDPDRIEQIEDRVHRASSNHKVTIWNLVAVNTVDQAIMERVSKRYEATRKLLDGSRGVDFARKVLAIINKETASE